MTKKFVLQIMVIGLLVASSNSAMALEAYSDQQKQEFVSWCTGAKSASETTCSCTVKNLAQTVPTTALAQFLSSQGNFSLSTTAITTGASVTQALLACSK